MEPIHVERILDGDGDLIAACEAMLNREMECQYTSRTQLLSVMDSPRCILLGAFSRGSIAGVIIGKRLTKEESRAYLEQKGFDVQKYRGETVGIITRGAASLEHQGLEVERLLQEEIKSMLLKWGCDLIIPLGSEQK